MLLKYGSYAFPVGQVEVLPSLATERDESGRPIQYRWTINISGMILRDSGVADTAGAANLSAYDNVLRSFASLTGGDLTLYDNLGLRTSLDFPNNRYVLCPMTCTMLQYPSGGAGEYVTIRSFKMMFEVTYEAPARAGTWTSYQESVSVHGSGGRVLVWQPSINGPPVPCEVYPETTIRVVVAGSATGYEAPPQIPKGPLPAAFLINPQQAVTMSSPRWLGGRIYREFPASWNYIYEGRVGDLNPKNLIARPWPGGR